MRRLAPCPASASASTARSARVRSRGFRSSAARAACSRWNATVRGNRPAYPFGQPVRDAQVQPLPLAPRASRRRRRAARRTRTATPWTIVVAHEQLVVLGLVEQLLAGLGDQRQLVEIELTTWEDRRPAHQLARGRRELVDAGRDHGLHGRREQPPARSRTRRRQVPLLAPQHAHDLHDEERVPAGAGPPARRRRGGGSRPPSRARSRGRA